jgi:hypothetical protein
MKTLKNILFISFLFLTSINVYSQKLDAYYGDKLIALQKQLVKQQKVKGEWAGINEGDPRWDIFFMLYSYALYKDKQEFMTKKKIQRIISETIYRVKTFRGYHANGWSLHGNQEISKELTSTIILGFKSINKDYPETYFPTQYNKFKELELNFADMSVLDRSLFRMAGVWSEIFIPFVVTPQLFSFKNNDKGINLASLGYYRWGYVALAVWKHYNNIRKLGLGLKPLTQEDIDRGGAHLNNPSAVEKGGNQFWGREGLSWLLKRPYADGNPAPTLIVQMALHSAHRVKAVNLSGMLKQGWEKMDNLRFKMRNKARVFQPSISPIWDTARVLSGLQHIPADLKINKLEERSSSVNKAVKFLLNEQDVNGGDYIMANPNFKSGGWGFAYGSNKYPDSDDTAMVVDALLPIAKKNKKVSRSVKKGVDWLIQMQNPDGGFPAWDYDATKSIEFLIQNTSMLPNTSLEPQSDVTARVLRALKRADESKISKVPSSVFEKGCTYLKNKRIQSNEGLNLWAGTWAVNYLYGTSESLSTLIELGCLKGIQLEKYATWIMSLQNNDGGWGESIETYEVMDFVAKDSSITQTLGVLQLLLTYENHRIKNKLTHLPSVINAIERGVNYYLPKVNAAGDIHDENEKEFTACYACPTLYVRYDLIPLYMGTEVLGKFIKLQKLNMAQELK